MGKVVTSKLTCRAKGDILPASTVEEAKKIISKLAESVSPEKAVPKTARLCPISELTGKPNLTMPIFSLMPQVRDIVKPWRK